MMAFLTGGWFTFRGRACRQEFWVKTLSVGVAFVAFAVPAYLVAGWISLTLMEGGNVSGTLETVEAVVAGLLWLSLPLACLLATALSVGVAVRRYHDRNLPGWLVVLVWLLNPALLFLPGLVQFVVLGCLDGTPGPNRYGPDPKDPCAAV